MTDPDQKQKRRSTASTVAAILGILLGAIAVVWGVMGMLSS